VLIHPLPPQMMELQPLRAIFSRNRTLSRIGSENQDELIPIIGAVLPTVNVLNGHDAPP